jgi:hypothetical protein
VDTKEDKTTKKFSPSYFAVVVSSIRDPRWIKSGSGINIPDTQYFQTLPVSVEFKSPFCGVSLQDPTNTK